MSKLGQEIYSGAADFGKIGAVVSALFCTLIAVCMIIGGIYIIQYRSKLLFVDGEIIGDSVCYTVNTGKNVSTVCTTQVTYIIGGTSYTRVPVQTGSTFYNDKTRVTIWYSPDTPNQPQIQPIPASIGYFLIILAIIICFIAWIWVYITHRSKFAAAAGGVSQAWNLFK